MPFPHILERCLSIVVLGSSLAATSIPTICLCQPAGQGRFEPDGRDRQRGMEGRKRGRIADIPAPGNPSDEMKNADRSLSGTTLPSSGRVRVTVSPDKVHVEYVRSFHDGTASPDHKDGEVAFACDVRPRAVGSGAAPLTPTEADTDQRSHR